MEKGQVLAHLIGGWGILDPTTIFQNTHKQKKRDGVGWVDKNQKKCRTPKHIKGQQHQTTSPTLVILTGKVRLANKKPQRLSLLKKKSKKTTPIHPHLYFCRVHLLRPHPLLKHVFKQNSDWSKPRCSKMQPEKTGIGVFSF